MPSSLSQPWILLLFGALSFGVGAAVTTLWVRRRRAAELATSAALRARLEDREHELARLEHDVAELRDASTTLREERARLSAELDGQRTRNAEAISTFERLEERFKDAFGALSTRALEASQRSFVALAKESIGHLHEKAVGDLDERRSAIDGVLGPIAEQLRQVDLKLGEVERNRTGAYAALREQVAQLAQTQGKLHDETERLSRALHSPTVRGRWGEIQLRRVVELAGMVEHCDFVTQREVEGERRLRPDLVVRLPAGRQVIVDAKTPLDAYLVAIETDDPEERERALAEHARQVRAHVQQLASKAYQSQFDASPEFVVMFLPGETFFSAALRKDPSLIEYGAERYVIPASPTTLIALLRGVHYGWQQHTLAENAARVRELGATLFERLRTLSGHFEDVRTNLDRTVTAYNRAVRSIETRVFVTARRLRELGVGSGDDLPSIDPLDDAPQNLELPFERPDPGEGPDH